ncbi:MAG: hypothetical protein COT06_05830 [Syntrophobacteraceae bacterium CG07_land_8_20_14_0_80_61_8]|nr:MAG: hypothetical protein COT06_05830 [Syntrophobacteraceae bacterium CG07_land_8_20_14_0_80_61_8]
MAGCTAAFFAVRARAWRDPGRIAVARVDDFKEALRLASEQLRQCNLHRQAKLAGAEIRLDPDDAVVITFALLGREIAVRIGVQVTIEETGSQEEISLPNKVLICHYLLTADGAPPTGELITYRQVPDGHFYFDAFQRRARDPFLKGFGAQPELFRACAEKLGGVPVENGDLGMRFQVLPRVPIQIILWFGDDEFPPEASLLFDANVSGYLPAEDIAFVSGNLVYALMGIARNLGR